MILCSHKYPQTNKGETRTLIEEGLTSMHYFPHYPGLYFPHIIWLILEYMLHGFYVNVTIVQCKTKREEAVNLRAKQSLANAVSDLGKEGFCSRFCAAVGIGSIAKRDVFCCALFDQVLNPCDQ